jgi:hypothetical protein
MGFGTTFIDTGGYQKARTISVKRVTGRNFTICDFREASKNFIFDFLHKKTIKNCKKRPFRKCCFGF